MQDLQCIEKFKSISLAEEYAKEKYMLLFNAEKEAYKRIFKGMEEFMPNDEAIKSHVEKVLDVKNMSNHSTIVPGTEYDYYQFISCIQGADREHNIIVLLDKDKKPIASKITDVGDAVTVGDVDRPYSNVFKYILDHPEAHYFIHVHNHPYAIANIPSTGDKSITYAESILGDMFGVKMLDSCIISEFDFYSQCQAERKDKKKLLKHNISDNLFSYIKREDSMLYRFLKRGTF